MNRAQLVKRVRSLTRDLSNSIFREIDITDYIDEGMERLMQYIPELSEMTLFINNTEEPKYLPKPYHHLVAIYSASRCFAQDNQNYQASTLMNEFEGKMDELKMKIENGSVVIKDPDGNPVESTYPVDYVVDNYFNIPDEEE